MSSSTPDAPTVQHDTQRSAQDVPVRRQHLPGTRPASGPLPAAAAPPRLEAGAPVSDRVVDADLLLDVPQLSVEELTLEVDASALLNALKLEAKGLELGLYLKADFENLRALAEQRRAEGIPADPPRRRPAPPKLLQSGGQDGDGDGGGESKMDRARDAIATGAKTASVTLAGIAGGALLEGRGKPTRKLPWLRRRSRLETVRDEIAKRLP